jgi:hypothetical protein
MVFAVATCEAEREDDEAKGDATKRPFHKSS